MSDLNYTHPRENGQSGSPSGGAPRASGGGAAGERAPLSMAHILPHGSLTVWPTGSKIVIAKPRTKLKKMTVVSPKRGAIHQYTPQSRRRFLKKLAEVNKTKGTPYFLTLTYPAAFPDIDQAKKHFQAFLKRMKRRFPGFCGFWKLEPQKRGAPHFHCLIWGMSGYDRDLSLIVARIWFQIAGSGDTNHLFFHIGALPGSKPCVTMVRSWKGVMSYASKYMGKVINIDGWDEPGRFWGCFFRDDIPWSAVEFVRLTYLQSVKLMRLLRRRIGVKARQYQSLTGFVDSPGFWLDRLPEIVAL